MTVVKRWTGSAWEMVGGAPSDMVTTDTAQTISAVKTFSTSPQILSSNPVWELSDGTRSGGTALASSGGSFHTSALAGDIVVRGDAAGNTQGVLLAAGPTSTGYVRVASAGVTVGGTLAVTGAALTLGTGTGSPIAYFNGAATGFRGWGIQSGGLNRWACITGATAETGSNVGSNLNLWGYADDGSTLLGAWISIIRATGAVTIPGATTIGGTLTANGVSVFTNNIQISRAGAGLDLIKFTNSTANNSFYLRTGSGGSGIEFVNNAYSATVLSISDAGVVSASGQISATGPSNLVSGGFSNMARFTQAPWGATSHPNYTYSAAWVLLDGAADTVNSPRLGFHLTGVVAAQIGMDRSGNIRTYDDPGTGYAPFSSGALTANGNITATGNVSAVDLSATGLVTGRSAGASGHAFLVGNDAYIDDVNVANTFGVVGVANSAIGAIKLGSSGPTLSGTGTTITVTGDVVASGGFTSTANGATSGFGNAAATGVYVDATNLALRLPGTGGVIYFQSASGATGISGQYTPSSGRLQVGYVEATGTNGPSVFATTGTNGPISVSYNGATADNNSYGLVGVTAPASVNTCYYSMTESGTRVFGIGIDASHNMRIGAVSSGKTMDAASMLLTTAGALSVATDIFAGASVVANNGVVQAKSSTANSGYVQLNNGTTTNAGYVAFYGSAASPQRHGYIGFGAGNPSTIDQGVINFVTGTSTFTNTQTSAQASTVGLAADATGGRGPEIAFSDTKAGQATPNKYIRAQVGALQFVNSAYNSVIASLSDSGVFSALSQVQENGVRVYSPGNPPPASTHTISSQTTTYSVAAGVTLVLANGTFTVTIPAASASTGREINVKNTGTGTITVATSGGNIDGASTAVISTQYNSITVVSDGTNWHII